MDLRDFYYINSIAKYQSITKAAEALYITQPTLSKFLINLEKELGQPLFKRIGRRYIPTYAGERYIEAGTRILVIKNELDAELSDILKKNIGVLNVGFPTMRLSYFLPYVLPKFKSLYPNVKVNIFEGFSSRLDTLILNGEIDISFSTMPQTKHPQLTYETLGTEEILICVPKGHPIRRFAVSTDASSHPSLDPKYLQDEQLLCLMKGQRTRETTDSFLKARKLDFKNVMYFSNIRAIVNLVAMGYGITFMFEPHILQTNLLDSIDLYHVLPESLTYDFVVARREGSYVPQYMRDFINLAREAETTQHLR